MICNLDPCDYQGKTAMRHECVAMCCHAMTDYKWLVVAEKYGQFWFAFFTLISKLQLHTLSH